MQQRAVRVAILYPTDPAGFVPSGIASFIRGILKYAPDDVEYTLIGATSNPAARPVGKDVALVLGDSRIRFLPIVTEDPGGRRRLLPLTVRYVLALRKLVRDRQLENYDVLDFHRIEPIILFRRDRRPKNLVLHNDMDVLRNPNSDIMWRHMPWLYEFMEGQLFKHVDRVFCVRQTAVERYVARYSQLDGRVSFIPTWVDTDVFKPVEASQGTADDLRLAVCKKLNVNSNSKFLISVGRLDHQKDPLLLVEAFNTVHALVPELHLLLVGDGVLHNKVTAVVEANGLQDSVHFLGAQPGPRIAELLRASDLFVLSSAYEGMPIALLEALATGTPVVTTDVGEVRLVVRDDVNGYIAVPRTPVGFADAICRGLENAKRVRGKPCTTAVEPYYPGLVLQRIYENHRRQARNRTT